MKNYYKNTLSKLRKRSKRIKCKFRSIKLKVGTQEVDLNTFRMLEGIDFKYEFNGITLLKEFRFTVSWQVGQSIFDKELVGDVGFWYDGASIPPVFHDTIGKPLDPKFMLPSLGHDIAVEQGMGHWSESMVLYRLLRYQKGSMDLPWWKERAMYLAVYSWSLIS